MAHRKSSANGGQLLLLAALLFGIVTMHTLGHPTGHGGGTERAAGQHGMSTADSGHARVPAAMDAGAHVRPGAGQPLPGAIPSSHARTAPAANVASASVPAGMAGMDPLSVCLAVLAGLTLLLLLRAGLLRPGGFAVPPRPLAPAADGLRPDPPPPRILLSHLSVLRI
ncbi:hypothetical protein [Streptomyces sp. NPDC048436]|uniref:hypothetical protein n=1 Tax=Streptomyces sp. NPDC048436 TaxID=3365550 RepID=UPI00371B8252